MADLTHSILRILNTSNETIGTGFVLTDDGLIVTCAHIVQNAGAGPGDIVRLIFHATGDEALAIVEPDGWRASAVEDIAILRLDRPLPERVKPLSLGPSIDSANHPFETFGFPETNPNEGLWGTGIVLKPTTINRTKVLQLLSTQVSTGFSGAPVLDTVQQQIVGMITAIAEPDTHGRQTETAFITPLETIVTAWPALPLSPTADPLSEYRQRILSKTEFVSLKGIVPPTDPIRRVEFPLERMYIQLQAVKEKKLYDQREAAAADLVKQARKMEGSPVKTPVHRNPIALLQTLGEELYQRGETVAETRPEPVNPAEALQKERLLVILGAPGAGKSTLLRFLARQAIKMENGPVPILVSAREYATDERQTALRHFALEQVCRGDKQLEQALIVEIDLKNVLWLVDGLDEAGGDGERVAEEADGLPGQVIIASRPIGYLPSLPRFAYYEILQLTPADTHQFLRNWFEVLAPAWGEDPIWAQSQVTSLQAKIAERPRLAPLLRNPLLLTFLAILFAEQPDLTLPNSRAALYRKYIEELLLRNWERQRSLVHDETYKEPMLQLNNLSKTADVEQVLWKGFAQLGWHLHRLYYGGQTEAKPDRETLTSLLAGDLQVHLKTDNQTLTLAKEIIKFWEKAGLLDSWRLEGETFFTFRHFTFQEYAAALRLAEAWQSDPNTTWQWLKPRLHLAPWREPLLLMSSVIDSHEDRKALLRYILDAHSPYEHDLHRDLRLAAMILGEVQAFDAKLKIRVIRRLGKLSHKHGWEILLTLGLFFLFSWLIIGGVTVALLGMWVGIFIALLSWPILYGWSMVKLPLIRGLLFFPAYLWSPWGDRKVFMELLGQTGDPAAVPYLVNLLYGKPTTVRRSTAAEALVQIGLPAVPYLIAQSNRRRYFPNSGIRVLGQIGGRDAVEHLLTIKDRASSFLYQEEVFEALGETRDSIAVEPLIDTLRNPKTEFPELLCWVHETAVIALGQRGDSIAVESLTNILYNKNNSIELRYTAIEALGQIGNPVAIDCLVTILNNKNEHENIRRMAADALKQNDVSVVEVQSTKPLKLFKPKFSSWRRKLIAIVVGRFGETSIVDSLIESLDDIDRSRAKQQQAAAKALGQIGDTTAVTPLMAVLETEKEHYELRQAAVEALGQIGDPAAIPCLNMIIQNRDEKEEIRQAAVAALGQIGEADTVSILVSLLNHEDKNLHKAAVNALGQVGTTAVIPHLITSLSDSEVRREAEKALIEIGRPAVPALINLLDNSSWPENDVPARILGQIGDPVAIPHLVKTLERYRRSSAATSLGQFGVPAAIPQLLKTLKTDDWVACCEAAEALGLIGDPIVVPDLIELLENRQDKWMTAHVAAVEALGRLGAGDHRAVSFLESLLENNQASEFADPRIAEALAKITSDRSFLRVALIDNSSNVRVAAATTLGKTGEPSVALPLINALRDNKWKVAYAAGEALKQLSLVTRNKRFLQKLVRKIWWQLIDSTGNLEINWHVMDKMVQQLSIVKARDLPASDLPVISFKKRSKWRIAGGGLLVVIGLTSITLAQDLASNLLANRLEEYIPPDKQGLLILGGLILLLGGVGMLWKRRHFGNSQ